MSGGAAVTFPPINARVTTQQGTTPRGMATDGHLHNAGDVARARRLTSTYVRHHVTQEGPWDEAMTAEEQRKKLEITLPDPEQRRRNGFQHDKRAATNRKLRQHLHDLSKRTRFSVEELERLLVLFRGFSTKNKGLGELSRQQFSQLMSLLGLHTPLIERIYSLFNTTDNGAMEFKELALGLATMLRGTFDARVLFCFRVYDTHENGFLARQDMYNLFDQTLDLTVAGTGAEVSAAMFMKGGISNKEERDRDLWDLVSLMQQKMDVDKDGRVDFNEYRTYVQKDSLLLEAFGPVFPPLPRKNEQLFCQKLPDAKASESEQDAWEIAGI